MKYVLKYNSALFISYSQIGWVILEFKLHVFSFSVHYSNLETSENIASWIFWALISSTGMFYKLLTYLMGISMFCTPTF